MLSLSIWTSYALESWRWNAHLCCVSVFGHPFAMIN